MDTINELSHLIAERILNRPGKAITADEPLISTGLIDSFNLVDLALLVEDTYGVRIDDSELNQDTFDTLSELAGLIESRKK